MNWFTPWRNPPAAALPEHLALGALGERLALDFLLRRQYRLVATNFTVPIGHSLRGRPITGEIDLIAYDESVRPFVLAFIEVKTRTSDAYADPASAVDRAKQRHIIRAARFYRRWLRVTEEPYRYDVVSVLLPPGAPPRLELLRGYFSEQPFARSRWHERED